MNMGRRPSSSGNGILGIAADVFESMAHQALAQVHKQETEHYRLSRNVSTSEEELKVGGKRSFDSVDESSVNSGTPVIRSIDQGTSALDLELEGLHQHLLDSLYKYSHTAQTTALEEANEQFSHEADENTKKLAANRIAASRCRKRKRTYTKALERLVFILAKEILAPKTVWPVTGSTSTQSSRAASSAAMAAAQAANSTTKSTPLVNATTVPDFRSIQGLPRMASCNSIQSTASSVSDWGSQTPSLPIHSKPGAALQHHLHQLRVQQTQLQQQVQHQMLQQQQTPQQTQLQQQGQLQQQQQSPYQTKHATQEGSEQQQLSSTSNPATRPNTPPQSSNVVYNHHHQGMSSHLVHSNQHGGTSLTSSMLMQGPQSSPFAVHPISAQQQAEIVKLHNNYKQMATHHLSISQSPLIPNSFLRQPSQSYNLGVP